MNPEPFVLRLSKHVLIYYFAISSRVAKILNALRHVVDSE
jgi:hypothetical protein